MCHHKRYHTLGDNVVMTKLHCQTLQNEVTTKINQKSLENVIFLLAIRKTKTCQYRIVNYVLQGISLFKHTGNLVI